MILFEGVDEYMVNKFVELDKRLAAMEKEIEQLKRVLGETQIGVQQLLNR